MSLAKCENFRRAFSRLQEAISEYNETPTSTVLRDGVFHRFEFTFELAWKSLKEYMETQGASRDLNFPKGVLKAAYASRLISNDAVWLDMMYSRNITSHFYDDAQASQVLNSICKCYLFPLSRLSDFYASLDK